MAPVPDVPAICFPRDMDRDRLERLSRQLSDLIADHPFGVVSCDVGALQKPTLTMAEALTRLHLTARRSGGRLALRHVGPELESLLRLTASARSWTLPRPSRRVGVKDELNLSTRGSTAGTVRPDGDMAATPSASAGASVQGNREDAATPPARECGATEAGCT